MTNSGLLTQGRVPLARAGVLLSVIGLAVSATAGRPPTEQFVARAILWAGAAIIALVRGTRTRPEPRSAWVSLGAGALLVAGSWYARAQLPSRAELGSWPDVLSSAGLFAMGLGLVLAGRGRRERVALFDGALLAGAVATFVWAVLMAPQLSAGATTAQQLAASSHVLGAILVLGVGVALMLVDRDARPGATPYLVLLLGATLIAGVGWSWQGLAGNQQAVAGAASWILAPLALIAIAYTLESDPAVEDADPLVGELLTPVRFALLVFLTVMPALTVGVLRAAPSMHLRAVPVTMGLWVTIASVIVLALRVRAVAGFAVEDERATAMVRFSHLIEHSADVVCVITPVGDITYLSPSARRVFGHDPDDLLGRNVTEFLEDSSPDRVLHLLSLAEEGNGRPVPVRLSIVDSDGLTRPAEGSITDLTNLASVAGLVVTLRDVSERVALEAELKRAALEDPLTGLANRTLLTDRIRHALAQQQRGGRGVALLFLDLDEFKGVNDTYGHAAGDRLLKHVAVRLESVIRDVDTAGRLGGDEFAVLLEGLPDEKVEDAAQLVVDRLFREFREPVEIGNALVEIQASVGIAVAEPGTTVEALVQNADMAMYAAKGRRGSAVDVFQPDMSLRGEIDLTDRA